VSKAYYRPKTKAEAIELFNRSAIASVFILGGSRFGNIYDSNLDMIDLQDIPFESNGASEAAYDGFELCGTIAQNNDLNPALKTAIHHDLTENQKNLLPFSGHMFTANGQSVAASILLGLDASVTIFSNGQKLKFGDWILLRQNRPLSPWRELEMPSSPVVRYELIKKTPGDAPELIVALAKWKSGRTRLVIGSRDLDSPQLVFDGTESGGLVEVTKNACSHLFSKSKSSDYLSQTTITLLNRLLSA
jgi:hypothetical protein